MLDISRLIGFVLYSPTVHSTMKLTRKLVGVTGTLEPEDLTMIEDQSCRGPGETTGAMLNLSMCPDLKRLVTLMKVNFNAIGQTDILVPKHVFVVSTIFDSEVKRTAYKLLTANEVKGYRTKLHLFVLGGKAEDVTIENCNFSIKPCTLDDIADQVKEIINARCQDETVS